MAGSMKDKPQTFDLEDEAARFRQTQQPADAEEPKQKVTTEPQELLDSRITKTVRMRLRFSRMLRDESYKRTMEAGERVTEAELLDEALLEWRRKHKVYHDV